MGWCALERGGAGFGYGFVLLACAAGDADRADDFAVLKDRAATGEDHHPTAVRLLDAEELASGLGEVGEAGGGDVEGARGPGFVDGDVDGAEPGVFHALEGEEVAAGADDGEAHGLVEVLRFLCGGFEDAASVGEREGFVGGGHVIPRISLDARSLTPSLQ